MGQYSLVTSEHFISRTSEGDYSLGDYSLGDYSLGDYSLGDYSLGNYSLTQSAQHWKKFTASLERLIDARSNSFYSERNCNNNTQSIKIDLSSLLNWAT